jgi:hypothetical protein
MSKYWYQLVGSVGVVMTMLMGCNSPQVAPKPKLNQPLAALPVPQVSLGEFTLINGTPYLHAAIYVPREVRGNMIEQIGNGSRYDSSSGDIDIRNYLFVNRDDLSGKKLFPHHNSRLLEMEQLGETIPLAKPVIKDAKNNGEDPTLVPPRNIRSLWYVTATADTNGDKLLDRQDRKQIAISDVSGTNYTEIIKDIDTILLVHPRGRDRRLVIYASGNKRFVAQIDIPQRLATIKELPSIN